MKVAIIGATGMIGHHTAAAALSAGHDVLVIHREGSDLSRIDDLQELGGFETAIGDLDSVEQMESAFKGADAVINCAAYYPTRPRPWREEVSTAKEQMERFYSACGLADVDRIVYLGGAIALRRSPDGAPGTEAMEYDSPPPTTNSYVQVKYAMHKQALEAARSGLPVVIGIPTMTLGEFDYGPSTGRFITEVANQTMPGFVDGRRNVLYAGDSGRGLLLAAEKGRPGEAYLFAGTDITMDDLMTIIARVAGVDKPKTVPLAAAKLLAKFQAMRYRFLKGPVPKLGETAIAVMSAGQFIDGSKARQELGFEPTLSVEEAVRRAYKWFVAQGMIV